MKTRVLPTQIWDSDDVYTLNIDTKLLYLILLTNPYIGQSRYYKISDRQLSTFSGLNTDQVSKCKKDLELANMVFFKEGYVCITGTGYIESFYRGEKNAIARERELTSIPVGVIQYFNSKLDTLSIPHEYGIDTTINTKSKSYILNTKDDRVLKKEKLAEIRKTLIKAKSV